jgi:hypothetical protein
MLRPHLPNPGVRDESTVVGVRKRKDEWQWLVRGGGLVQPRVTNDLVFPNVG